MKNLCFSFFLLKYFEVFILKQTNIMQITSREIRKKFLDFMESKWHKIIPSAPLVPENDPTALFNVAGMQPLVPYLMGEKHPLGTRLADCQKCIRTNDIEEVWDDSHLTFFEMLWNWSLWDYFKEESIAWSFEFLTSQKCLWLDPKKIAVTVFEWDNNAPKDEESAEIWKKVWMPKNRISYLPKSENWWAAWDTGPCGPDTEIFYWVGNSEFPPEGSNVENDEDNWMEIWNNVFMEYYGKSEEFSEEEKKKEIDDITSKIIWEAIKIHKKYWNTLTEKQINKMFTDNLESIWLKVEREKSIPIIENGKKYGNRFIDILVNDNIIIELKNNRNEAEIKKWFLQVRNYLDLWDAICWLLLNFAFPTLWINRFNNYEGTSFRKLLQTSTISPLPQKNVDTGMWIERITTILNWEISVYHTDIFKDILNKVVEVLKTEKDSSRRNSLRIIADHSRTATMLISDWVTPSNTEQWYILRRLIRRAIRQAYKLWFKWIFMWEIAKVVISQLWEVYPNLVEKREEILKEIKKEETQFWQTLEKWLKEFEKLLKWFEIAFEITWKKIDTISWDKVFKLYDTYWFPFEMTEELATEKWLKVDKEWFEKAFSKHQEKSRTASAWKFKGWLADDSEATTNLHTATHLLLSGLRKFVWEHVHQKWSNITPERLRFDFNNDAKVERETLDKIEEFVNEAIKSNLQVSIEEMDKQVAKDSWVEGSFWEKYPDIVKVYTMKWENWITYSRELCWGPHVETSENMWVFKIKKEQSSSAGVRRIKAVLVK